MEVLRKEKILLAFVNLYCYDDRQMFGSLLEKEILSVISLGSYSLLSYNIIGMVLAYMIY